MSEEIFREVLEVIEHCLLITLFIVNSFLLLFNYGHWFEVVIAETICIPLIYLVVFIACKVGDKE